MKYNAQMKVLYTKRYGAGWSSWNKDLANFMAKHPKIIQEVEKRKEELKAKNFTEVYYAKILTEKDECIINLKNEAKEKFGIEPFCMGCENLDIYETNYPVIITDRDGKETVLEYSLPEGYIPYE